MTLYKLGITVLAILTCAIVAAPSLWAYGNKERQAIRVFVFTASNPTGFVDPNHKDLTDSVNDLKKILARVKFTVVDDRSTADVSLEIIGRGYVPTGTVSTVTQGLSSTTSSNSVAAVRVTISAGDYSTTIDGISDTADYTPSGTWRGAAGGAYFQIDKWVRNNYDKLLSLRKK